MDSQKLYTRIFFIVKKKITIRKTNGDALITIFMQFLKPYLPSRKGYDSDAENQLAENE